jgi:PAS domain S-box-containing protein
MPDLSDSQPGDQRFRLAVEAAPAAMVMIDREGRIILVNAETETMFGYAREELLGQSVEILLPEVIRKRHIVLRDGFFANLKTRPMAPGRDFMARRKDGSQFPVQIGLNPIDGPDGPWVLSSIVDIGERKRSEEQFRLAIEAGSSAMVLVDQEGKIVLLNSHAAALFGYEQEELIGKKVEILLPDPYKQSRPELREGLLPRVPLGPVASGRDLHARRKDGSRFPAEVVLNPMETGKGTWVLVCIADLTFQSRKLESLGVLAGGIAHDFNNLLGSILADSELAIDALAAAGSPMEEMHNIRTVAIRAAEIVRELMIYAGHEETHREPIDLSWLAGEMLELLKVSIPKHIALKTDLGSSLPAVLGNAPQLRQLVMNLIINASEAIEQTGSIYLATSHVAGGPGLAPKNPTKLTEGDYVRLEVSDTGRGMTEEEQARVFVPFFTTKFAGRGLGLAVVQGIVRAHGGGLDLISCRGHGTTVRIFLPCAREHVEHDSVPGVFPVDPELAWAPRTVLLVEDEDALRLPVSKFLRKSGFVVVEAADGSAAIKALRAQRAALDLALLDMSIPGSSSLEVLREVSRLRPEIKVVLTSAYSREMVAFPSDAPPVSAFIRKPFQLSELLKVIRRVLAGHNARTAG